MTISKMYGTAVKKIRYRIRLVGHFRMATCQ